MIRHFRKHGWQHDTARRLVRRALPVAAGRILAPILAPVELKADFGRHCYRCSAQPGAFRACRLGKANQWARKMKARLKIRRKRY